MSKSRLDFGLFVWLLTCVNHSLVWVVKAFPLVCVNGLHVLAHILKQWGFCSPLSTTSEQLTSFSYVWQRCRGLGIPYPCSTLAVVSQDKNNTLQVLSWTEACELNIRMATETQVVGAAAATGLWSWWACDLFFIALPFFFFPHFCLLWNCLFLVLPVFMKLLSSSQLQIPLLQMAVRACLLIYSSVNYC